MTIRVALHHTTHYRFDRRVSLSPHEVRLRPAAHCRTPIHAYSLTVRPAEHFIHWQQDAYGNFVARVHVPDPTSEFEIRVDLIADITAINPFDFFIEGFAERFPFAYPEPLKEELGPALKRDAHGALFEAFVRQLEEELVVGTPITQALVYINQRVAETVAYLIRLEPGVQAPEVTLTRGSGSCRDSAWLLVQLLRHFGIAARFVSGYLIQLKADEKPLEGPEGPASDFTDLHAWCEAFIPGAGWIGMDATSGLLAGEGHIPLAVSAVPTSAAPVTGMTGICEATLEFSMRVERIYETPRTTSPYSASVWQSIRECGTAVDQALSAMDVRLTQGGEPTFVSADDMAAAEWNTEALGPGKWLKGQELIRGLEYAFAPGALLHYGQGKWYPGEPLPRWALSLFWRKDGVPLWKDRSLLNPVPNARLDGRFVRDFACHLAEALNLNQNDLIPAFENPWQAMEAEMNLPSNLDLDTFDLENADVRKGLVKSLTAGLSREVGLVLPLKGDGAGLRWQSSRWPLRQDRLYLMPGDSPMGLRLPLGSLPWVAPDEVELTFPRDPFSPEPPFPERADIRRPGKARSPVDRPKPGEVIRTALCIEIREGILHLFLPPLDHLEDYLALLSAIERVAVRHTSALRIEGYPPPKDSRLESMSVTPDPGVLEVNIHPSSDWQTLEKRTQCLYSVARNCGLVAEKFMMDGRHIGTGGGNHITLGAASPADSPFLRRPDLLVSLLTYWQQHPSLSYLFSGQFVGPTSQAPRVDEARDDQLYELEIAIQQARETLLPGLETRAPWRVDRLFRNLLIDITGNTHRAEFCIDKLYDPNSAIGRQGLLELRAFEMPPHYQMSLVQALLIRALIARFWKTPLDTDLIPWGTQLHDRFMLPFFIEADIRAVVQDLNRDGHAFDADWLQPFLAFRFPCYGQVVYEGIELTLRQAIEPWHVLGEEIAQGRSARFVDSSVERLEVRVRGLLSQQYRVLCNGRELPLHPTGTPGESVAGVRFKAWSPPSALHPTIGIQTPLVFDLYDVWNRRSMGGFTYHTVHPGGRNHDRFPINAGEAEARRRARFWDHGHNPGFMEPIRHSLNPKFPMTLDLRWNPHVTDRSPQ